MGIKKPVCDRDCENCRYDDCILTDEDLDFRDFLLSRDVEKMVDDEIRGTKVNRHAAQCRAYYEAHKAEIAARHRAYHEAHKAEITARQRAYREANKAEIAARLRAYYEAHRAEINARQQAYYKAHKAEIAERSRKYKEKKKKGGDDGD